MHLPGFEVLDQIGKPCTLERAPLTRKAPVLDIFDPSGRLLRSRFVGVTTCASNRCFLNLSSGEVDGFLTSFSSVLLMLISVDVLIPSIQ